MSTFWKSPDWVLLTADVKEILREINMNSDRLLSTESRVKYLEAA